MVALGEPVCVADVLGVSDADSLEVGVWLTVFDGVELGVAI